MLDINKLPKNKCSGFVVFDKIGKDFIVLMGSKMNEERIYEYFGGKNEKDDKTTLHTAVREFIEEIFNIKIDEKYICDLVLNIIKNNDIRDKLTLTHTNHNNNLTYFIGFDTLEKIYNYLKYGKYKTIEHFNLIEFIKNRKISGIEHNGLNEIDKLHLYFLKDVPKLKLRDVAKRITNHMFKKLYE